MKDCELYFNQHHINPQNPTSMRIERDEAATLWWIVLLLSGMAVVLLPLT